MNGGVIIRGFVFAFIASIGFSLLASLAICLGLDPETRRVADTMAPLLGLFTGTWLAVRDGSKRTGFSIGLVYVVLWTLLWLYLMARWNPVDWLRLGFARLTLLHVFWWAVAVAVATSGAMLRRRPIWFVATFACSLLLWSICAWSYGDQCAHLDAGPMRGCEIEREDSTHDGTVIYRLTLDAIAQSGFEIMPYDCDQDFDQPRRSQDANTTFLGQDLSGLVNKLNRRQPDKPVVCVVNGGFFGESNWSLAHHEEPMVFDGKTAYPVDLLGRETRQPSSS